MNLTVEFLMTSVYLPLCAHLALARTLHASLPGSLAVFGMPVFLGVWLAGVDDLGVDGANLLALTTLAIFVLIVALGWWWQDFQAFRDSRKRMGVMPGSARRAG